MATNQNNGQDAGPNTGQSVTDATPDYVFDGTSAAIVVPVGDALLNAEYSRSGPDLYLETPDGQLILVTNYFAQDIPPDLFTLAGSRITADVAAKLAGPRAPGQVAQNGDLSTLEEPIGTVDTIKGVITVIRADGTQVTLTEGDTLYQGDTLVSGADSAIGIIFADKSTMSMASNARIILDELIYDPQDMAANSQVFNVIQGAFMFTSGAIGKSDPEDVSVNTPVATIGIRGTKFGVSVDALDGATNVTIFEGAVFVQNGAGNVLLTGIGETTLIPSYTLPPSDPRMLGLDEIQRIYGDAIGFHPVRQEIPDDHAELDDDDLQDIADDLIDIETAAGGEQQPGEGASDEFGEIGAAGIGQSGLGGTPLGSGGDGSGEEGIPGAGSGGDGTGDDVEDIVTPGVDGPSTVEINPGVGVFDPETGVTHFTPSTPLTSGTDFSVSAPSGPGVQQLHLNAEQLGGPGGNAGLTLQSGSAPDDVETGNNSVSLSSTDGMDLSIHGFEELALTLGGGDDSIDIQDLGGTSIISDTVTIDAGDGNDVVLTSDGTTSTSLVIDGGAGNDFLNGGELDDEISGGSGNDTIQGGAGNDSISGGTGDDIIIGATGDDFLEGNEDNDIIVGSGGDDTLLGGSGDDTLEGGSGSDVVDGGTGDDRAIFIVGQAQTEGVNDAYDGGADTDTIVINYDAQALENPTFRQAILDIHAMLGNAASGSPEEFDTAPFQALGLDIQGFEAVELDGPAFAIPIEATPAGEEDGAILLNLAVVDVLSSKTVSVTIGNLNGATPSAGTDNGDGTFTLTAAQLDGLTITPAADSSEDLELSITVTTVDEFGNTESIGETLDVSIAAVADAPNVTAESVSGQEDTAIALNITATVADEDGSEDISLPTNLPPVQSGGGVFAVALDIQSIESPITITGFEQGTVFSAGSLIDDVLHLNVEDLPGLTLTPPANFSGDMDLTISVTATDTDPDTGETSTATTEQQFIVAVAGIADAPTLTIGDADGLEDNAIGLDIAAALTDDSETLSDVTISGLNGATLSAGTLNEDGSVTLTAAQLENLTITPPLNFSGDLTLSVSVTSTDGESTSTTTKDLTVSVTGVADEPTLSVGDVSGAEDTPIALNIDAALSDKDGSEELTVTVSGVPEGATLSAGTSQGEGVFTLTASELEGLTITPALDSVEDFVLSVSATATEDDGDTETTSSFDIAVSVTGTPREAVLLVSEAVGLEDAVSIPLSISVTGVEANDTIASIVISGLPEGASLSAGEENEDGSYTLVLGDLDGLTLTPPANSNVDFDLTVAVTTEDVESGETETVTDTLAVSLTGVADAASLTVSVANGSEDLAIPLSITASLTDNDGSEEITEIRLSNIPEGATLSAGTVDEETGDVILTAAELSGLTITPPTNFSGQLSLTVSVTTTEDDGDTETVSKDLTVSVAGVADAPTLTISDADGLEDNAIGLDIAAALTDESETLSDVTISGLNGATLSAGTVNEDGSVTLTAGQLENLTITPPLNFSGDLTLSVSVTSTDGESTSTTTKDLTVSIAGVADAPTLTISDADGLEDNALGLDIAAALTDESETLSDVTISGLNGAVLSAGTVNEDGSVTLTAGQLENLTITPPLNFSGDLTLSVSVTSTDGESTSTTTKDLTVSIAGVADAPTLTISDADGLEDNAIGLDIAAALTDESETLSGVTISGLNGAVLSAGTVNEDGSVTLTAAQLENLTITPPLNFSGDLTLSVSVTSTDGESTSTTTKDLTVSVAGVADAPTLTISDADGLEDNAIGLDIAAALTDESETLSGVTISGLNGATLSAGTVNEDGSVTLTAAQLENLTITPPLNFSGDLTLSVSVTSTDGESTSTTTKDLTVSIAGVADAPTLTISDADGLEDNAIGLDIAAALTDDSETLSGVTISGLNGATLSAGTVNEDGSVTLTAAQLENLTITPPLNFSGDLTLSVSVTSTDGESTSTTTKDLTVSIAGVADAPTLTISDADGLEDNAIGLDIAAALTDESETLSGVTISGLNGAVLSAGTVNEDGSVTLTAAQLENLTITPPLNFSGDLTLSVSVTSTDGESTSTTTKDLTVSIAGVADAPTLTVENASGLSGTAIALNIASALQDQDGSESLSVTIAGLPSGASLVDGNGNAVGSDQGNGVFGLSANQLSSLFVLTPEGLVDDFTLTVTATATESDGDSENTIKQLNVDITGGTAGEAVLTITDATGLEDNAIPLSIAVSEIEADDTATITLSGIPSGAVLKNGDGVVISVEDGEATLSPDDLDGLTITPPTDSDADFNLTVTVVTEDNASGEQASVSDTIAVTVGAVADAPDLDAEDVDGSEDTAIELDLAAALSDEDGSESLTDVVISGLPAGATLSAGVVQTDGSVKLTAAELEGLTLTPPQNFSGDIALTISATSEDGTEDSAEATKSFTVSVAGVADTPTLELGDTTGNLAAQIPVDITSSLTDLDGSEELTVTVSGLNGAILSAGTLNEDGTVTLTAEELDGLTITPVPNTLGAINLTVTATATEENGDTSSVTGTLKISVEDSSNVVLVAGQDLNLVAPVGETPGDTQKLVIDASFGGATTGDDWIIAQDELGRVTITNTVSGQLVTAAGYEEIDIDFGPGEDTVELRDLSNTDLSNNTLTLNMGDGDDTVVASEVVNRDLEIFGGDGNDNLQGSNGADLIDGGADDDVLVGGGGIDDLDGGEGSDNYLWSEGDGIDAYGDSGTEGTDTIVAQAATFDGFGDGFNAGQSGIEAIGRDSDGDGDVDPASPLLIALSDSSETVDFSGLDFLNSQTTIDLGGGDDTVISALADGDAVTYSGGEGQDTLNLLMSASSLNQMIASGQLGLLQSYIASPDNAVLTMTAPNIVAQGFEVVRIGILNENGTITDVTDSLANAIADNEGFGEFLVGSNDPDLVFAGGGNDIVRTFAGDDIVFAGEGEDFVNSGSGDDFVDGGSGNDIIDGGQGNDRLLGGDGADLVSGGQGDDVISGGDGNDFLAGFSGNDFIEGDAGDDFISGGSGDDTLLGGDGNDRLVGGSGNDLLVGGDGIDILEGEAGDDVLISDGFEDQLLGGSGNDVLISTMDDLPTSPVPSGAQGQFSGIRDGGTGEDTFRLDSSDVGPHSLSGDELSHIRNIETLDLSGVDELQLSLRVEDVVTMTDEDNDLTILLGENVTSVQIDDETIQLENGQAVFQQDGVQVILQQQQPAPEAS